MGSGERLGVGGVGSAQNKWKRGVGKTGKMTWGSEILSAAFFKSSTVEGVVQPPFV